MNSGFLFLKLFGKLSELIWGGFFEEDQSIGFISATAYFFFVFSFFYEPCLAFNLSLFLSSSMFAIKFNGKLNVKNLKTTKLNFFLRKFRSKFRIYPKKSFLNATSIFERDWQSIDINHP